MMNTHLHTPCLVLLLSIVGLGTAHAQQAPEEESLEAPEPSQGHYLALGLSSVRAQAFDDGRGLRKPTYGTAFDLRLGQSITSWADLGLAFSYGSTDGEEEHKLSWGGVRVQGQVYPSQHWFLRGGFGPYGAGGADPEDSAFDRGAYGVMYELGVGLNIFLSDAHESGGWVLTPTLMNQIGHNPGVDKNGTDAKFTTHVMSLGVEISWWSGLPRDQLDLSIDRAYEREDKEPVYEERDAKNSINLELGGPADGSSLNYERAFGDVGVRLGYGKADADDGAVVSVPVTVSYLGIGSMNHMLEIGAGGAIAHVSGAASKHGFDGDSYGGWGAVMVGYRRQPADGGFQFRAGASPLITREGVKSLTYLSLGGSF